MKNNNKFNRRAFLKSIGFIGIGSTLTLGNCKNKPEDVYAKNNYPKVPTRRLGKTNLQVPILNHGIMYNLIENQIVIHNGLKWGINYIDTANSYAGGNSELGLGKFLSKFPEKRKDLIIVSKASRVKDSKSMEKKLQLSLKRMNTDYIDIYYGIHGLNDPGDLTNDIRKWAESAKKRKLIKHFGFSTHKNMANCLMAASKLDWIDVIMTSWNFHLMQERKMQNAIEACSKSDIGLVAMKIMGMEISSDGDYKLAKKFMDKGFTDGQVKLKIVLEDKRIATACVTMPSAAMITTNVAAVLDKKKLGRNEKNILIKHAKSSCTQYCSGCSEICDSALPEAPYISDIMRYLMYFNNYNEQQKAKSLFLEEVPPNVRKNLLTYDYSSAELMCPKNLKIGEFIKEAVNKLA